MRGIIVVMMGMSCLITNLLPFKCTLNSLINPCFLESSKGNSIPLYYNSIKNDWQNKTKI